MSALGEHVRSKTACPLYPRKRTCAVQLGMSALGQKRTHAAQQKDRYSISSSARASSSRGTVIPSALAVLRLIASSYLIAACTGRSAGFSTLKNTINVAGSLPVLVDKIRPIRDQTASDGKKALVINCRQLVSSC